MQLSLSDGDFLPWLCFPRNVAPCARFVLHRAGRSEAGGVTRRHIPRQRLFLWRRLQLTTRFCFIVLRNRHSGLAAVTVGQMLDEETERESE